ncbi:uncharacterized protein PG998_004607 [Apiospora kogelbergensis]|uniref:uncharacterized protein n=1 Tax=Apiospora kogelbergensis TaxID=1337665 RepID=UPI00312CC76B
MDLSFPFFVVEVKAYGHTNGNLWVATNQCIGGSLTCVEAISQLNKLLESCKGAPPVGNMAFSIAMDQLNAQFYVSWKTEEGKYYMQEVDYVCLKRPEGYLKLRRYIHSILDWGRGPRLKEIQKALDTIYEADHIDPSENPKDRSPPSLDSDPPVKKRARIGKIPKRWESQTPG